MKTRILLALFVLMFASPAFSQGNKVAAKPVKQTEKCNPEELRQKVKVQMVGYLTTELNLTKEEAEKFWPIYNKYEQERTEVRIKMRDEMKKVRGSKEGDKGNRKDFMTMSDDEARSIINTHLSSEKSLLDIQSKYVKEFEKAIPIQKVAKMYHSEKKFMAKLLRGKEMSKPGVHKKGGAKGNAHRAQGQGKAGGNRGK